MTMTSLFYTPSELSSQIISWRQHGMRVALVPTMGALHTGHLSLVTLAKKSADKVVASIFVNPTQFGPNEDFSRYPRMQEADVAKLETVEIDAIYLPSAEIMYPEGFSTTISVKNITEILCGKMRPGHFDGVATVVAKLLIQSSPDIAIFGEKDYQQLQVIKRLVADLNLPVEIIGAPIMRERDGLAMSSRNQYLSTQEREIALILYRVLNEVAASLTTQPASALIPLAVQKILNSGFSSVDYLELRSADTLELMEKPTKAARLFLAAQLGKTRLIDNIAIL